MIRNPVYCGKILVPATKDEEASVVPGVHEPLISEALFYGAQDVLDGRKRRIRPRMEVDDMIPLRGFLICPKCGKTLSGSASSGRHSKYYYYHCTAACGCRFAAQNINSRFEEEIQKYTPHPGIVDLYRHIVSINYINKNKGKRDDLQLLNNQLAAANKELATARHLLVTESIDPSDYRSVKTGLDDKIARLEAQISQLSQNLNNAEVKQLLEKASTTVSNLHRLYHDGDVFFKRQLVSAIYPL